METFIKVLAFRTPKTLKSLLVGDGLILYQNPKIPPYNQLLWPYGYSFWLMSPMLPINSKYFVVWDLFGFLYIIDMSLARIILWSGIGGPEQHLSLCFTLISRPSKNVIVYYWWNEASKTDLHRWDPAHNFLCESQMTIQTNFTIFQNAWNHKMSSTEFTFPPGFRRSMVVEIGFRKCVIFSYLPLFGHI